MIYLSYFYIHKKYYLVKCRSFWRLNQQKRVEIFFELSFFKNLQFDPIPTRLCHVIYCHGDKNYPCLVEVGLTEIDSLYCHRISEIKKKIVSKHKRYKQWMCSFKTNLNPFYKTYLDSLRLKNRNGPLWSPCSHSFAPSKLISMQLNLN